MKGWQEFAAPRSHLPSLAGGVEFKATKWKEKQTGDYSQSRRDLAIQRWLNFSSERNGKCSEIETDNLFQGIAELKEIILQ